MKSKTLESSDEPPDLREILDQTKIFGVNRESLIGYFYLLSQHSPIHANHSLRVCRIAEQIGRFIEENHMYQPLRSKPLVYMGLLHDVGKLGIDRDILENPWQSREQHIDVMRKHPLLSYTILTGGYQEFEDPSLRAHPYSAVGGLLHHEFQTDSYPKQLPKLSVPFSGETIQGAMICSKLVALADSYDAAVYRSGRLNHQEAIEMLLKGAEPKERDLLRLIELSGAPVFKT